VSVTSEGFPSPANESGADWPDATVAGYELVTGSMKIKGTHNFTSIRVDPAEPLRHAVTMFDVIAELRVVLMYVPPKQRRVDR